LDISGATATMGGYVRRCRVALIKRSKIHYEAAIILDDKFSLPLNAELHVSPAHPLHASINLENAAAAL